MVKPGYKQTEIGVIPEDWDLILFEDCFSVLSNNTLSRAELNYNGGELQNIHYGDILVKFSAVTNCGAERLPYVNAELVKKVSKGFLRDGDIVIADTAEDNTVGKATEVVAINGNKVVSGLHTIPCRPKDDKMFVPMWLGYFINHNTYHNQLLPYITGIKVSSISKSAIAGTMIAVPKSDEQMKIVAALSDIDALITNLEKLIAKKKAIKQGAMQELLTGKRRLKGFRGDWHDIAIGSFADVYAGGTPSTANPAYWGGDIPWMSSGELNKKVVSCVQGRITQAGLENSSTRIIPAHCVLIGLAGQGKTRGTAAYNTISLCTNQSIAAILPNPSEFDSKFLYYYMDTQYKALRELSDGGGGRGGLTKKLIEEFSVRIPVNLEEQVAIASVFTDIDYEIEKLEKELNKYRGIKSGMMSELLTGRIRLV